MTPGGERVAGILLAAGFSTRLGQDKIWMDLAGAPLLSWPIRTFARCSAIDDLILLVAAEAGARAEQLIRELGVRAQVVTGGARRQDSVWAGLEAADQAEWVVVHDAARPLVTADLIVRGLEAARDVGAAIAAVPETNTLKLVRDGLIVETLDRGHLWAAQTPQVFRRDLLMRAHQRYHGEATDDAAMVEALGVPVRVYEGAYANMKLTVATDEKLVAAYLREEQGVATASPQPVAGTTRTGFGYDVHRLVAGRVLVLGGVQIPHPRGLEGHSDGDVLTHAVGDALIGAMGAGDLGQWFPDTDEAYRGADSLALLQRIADKLTQEGWRIGNVDASIVAQQPRLAPHLDTMRSNLARVLQIGVPAVNVKATSPEGVGSLGREEAISAFATALIGHYP